MRTVRDLIDQQAFSKGEGTFICSAEADLNYSYLELQQCAQNVERYLDHKKIARGETVAFMLDNGCWTAILMLAIMYSGRTVLPLNVVAGPDQLSYVIDHSDLKLIFCSPNYQEAFSRVLHELPSDVAIVACDIDMGPPDLKLIGDVEQNANSMNQFHTGVAEIQANDIALLIYTSGTTGKPKGVLLSHGNVIAGGQNTRQAHGLTGDDRTLCILPLYHINAEMVSILGTLVSGGTVVVSHKLSIRRFWHWILDHHCTWFSAVPTVFAYLIERQQVSPLSKQMSESLAEILRFARSASAPLSPAVHEAFESAFGVPIVETMGISECAGPILSNPLERSTRKIGSTGIPWGNAVRVVDDNHQVVAPNAIGEIAVHGPNIMQGYYKNPAETQKSLDDEGWFYTGDLGYMDDDGFIFVTGRLKELIIKGGENIAPREIDDVLYQHPLILEAAAFAVEDALYGQEIEAAVAFRPGKDCAESELLEHCENLLGEFKTPRRIHLLHTLPKGPSGKIQRLKLPELVEN